MASPLMRIPAELRLMIYSYLFDAGDTSESNTHTEEGHAATAGKNKGAKKTISIRNARADDNSFSCKCSQYKPPPDSQQTQTQAHAQTHTRTRYRITERAFRARCVEATYALENKRAHFCTALMRVNRAVAAETAHLVYGGHVFDFGADIEAVKPFLSDLSPATRALVTRVAIYKRGPWLFDSWSDRCEWRTMCSYLRDHASVEHLRLVVQAGRLPETRRRAWEEEWAAEGEANGPRELSSKDVALLVDIRHDTLDWVGDLVRLKRLRDVEVLPDFCTVPPPQTSNMFVFMALSASVDKGFSEFLRGRLGLAC